MPVYDERIDGINREVIAIARKLGELEAADNDRESRRRMAEAESELLGFRIRLARLVLEAELEAGREIVGPESPAVRALRRVAGILAGEI